MQVVGPDVYTRMMTARTVDALPIDAARGIELNLWCQLVVQLLGQLPVGMTIDRLVPLVCDVVLGLRRVFLAGVLPSVRMLKLKVSIAR